jgi:hypothetical protein
LGIGQPAATDHSPTSLSAGPTGDPIKIAETIKPAAEASQPIIDPSALGELGANAPHRAALLAASARTGLPAAALTAIVDAEAGKAPDGSWNLLSRNARSSAAGLGQFLSGTWIGMAQQPGTWLHRQAAAAGWLDDNGKVRGVSRTELLALRYDATASLETVADYASTNIARLKNSGIVIGEDVRAVADAAYIGHHLGAGDALRFYRGTIDDGRARQLLRAQVGNENAARRIDGAGGATLAHRNWLTDYVQRNVRPDRYATAQGARSATSA